MPTNYVEIDSDEMEHVDGGIYISNQNLGAGLFAFISVYRVNALIASQ